MKSKRNDLGTLDSITGSIPEDTEIKDLPREDISIDHNLVPIYLLDPENCPLDQVFSFLIQQKGSLGIDDDKCFIPIVASALDLSNICLASMGVQILNLYKNKHPQLIEEYFTNFNWNQLTIYADNYFTDIFNDYCRGITNLSLAECIKHSEYMNVINQTHFNGEGELHLYLNLLQDIIDNFKPQYMENSNFDTAFNNMQSFLLEITETTYEHFLDVFQGMFKIISCADIFLPESIHKIFDIYTPENYAVAKPLSEIMVSLTKLDVFTHEQLDSFSVPEFLLNPENYDKARDVVKENLFTTIIYLINSKAFTPQLMLESGIADYAFNTLFQKVGTCAIATKFFLSMLCYVENDQLDDFYNENAILNGIFENLSFYGEKDLISIFRTMLKAFRYLTIDHPIVSEINTDETREMLEEFYEEFSEKISNFENEKRYQSETAPVSIQHENAHSLADCIYDAATMIQYFLDEQE